MNILVIHAWSDASRLGVLSRLILYPSLTLPTLVSLIPAELRASVDVVDENTQRVHYGKKQYDVVLISTETSSSTVAYRHADEFRKQGAWVAMGGYHPTSMPEEALEHADTVIVGAGDLSLPRFLLDFARGEPKRLYDCQSVDPALFPLPVRSVMKRSGYLPVVTIIANRGCNNGCKFCAIGRMWKSVPRPVGSVVDELRGLGVRTAVFLDPNFFGDREYALELMRAIEPLGIRWTCTATTNMPDDIELLAAARRSGCRGVLMGLESLNPVSLRDMRKGFNRADQYKEMIRRLHESGISLNGCFVLGFDGDTEELLLSLPDQIADIGLDLARFSILTPQPGSELFLQMEKQGRILTRDWSLYDQCHAVFRPKEMSAQRLEEIHRTVRSETYRWNRVAARLRGNPSREPLVRLAALGANIGFKYTNI